MIPPGHREAAPQALGAVGDCKGAGGRARGEVRAAAARAEGGGVMGRGNPQPGDSWKSILTNASVTVIHRESQAVKILYDGTGDVREMDLDAFQLIFSFLFAPEEASP